MIVRPHQLRGFTLIELIVVMIIVAIVLALAAPTLKGWGQGQKLRNSADAFIAATGYARSQAVTNATPYAVEIDSSANTFVVKSAAVSGVRKTVAGEMGVPMELPESYTIRLVSGGGAGMVGTTAAAADAGGDSKAGVLTFFPDSRGTPAVVEIKSSNGDIALISSLSPAEPFKKVDATQ